MVAKNKVARNELDGTLMPSRKLTLLEVLLA